MPSRIADLRGRLALSGVDVSVRGGRLVVIPKDVVDSVEALIRRPLKAAPSVRVALIDSEQSTLG